MSQSGATIAGDAEELFAQASKKFRDSISPHDAYKFKEFASPADMIRELTRDASHAESGKLNTFCRRIEAVSMSLSPFFDTVGIFVSSKPEIAALVWGAIRMLFLLSSHYTNFLDKLLAMLEKISYRLPGYAEYYNALVERRQQNLMNDGISALKTNRVGHVLSYIYTDITGFCQEACKLFSARKRGIRYKTSVIADLFWKPFDLRFKDTLGRLEAHHNLFHEEFKMEESKFNEIHYRRRQEEAEMASASAKQIHERLEQLRRSINSMENSVDAKFEQLSRNFQQRTIGHTPTAQEIALSIQPTLFDTHLRHFKQWLGAPDFSEEYQKAQSARFPDTCRWFLANSVYQRFKNHRLGLADYVLPYTLAERMVFVKGKPGYGKTTLSSLIIDDLTSDNGDTEKPLVLYYHFIFARANGSRPTHGLRAVLHQLVHQNRNRGDVMDALSVLVASEDSGQLSAMNSEVVQCLILLLKRLPDTTLVFDGVDECSDSEYFLQQIQALCSESPTKIVFIGRPSIDLPPGMERCGVISLEPWENQNDIMHYLQPKVIRLNEAKLLPTNCDCDEVVLTLATRSQGMFLWARLVIHYLSDRSLTPRERHDAIYNSEILDGMDNLYSRILQLLGQNSEARKKKIKRILQIMVATHMPFHISELQWMTAVTPGRVTTEDDLIVDFKDTLPSMMGALVELDSQEFVLFIHSSLREYLLGIDESDNSRFAVEVMDAACILMSICISYLTYDIPRSRITDATSSEDYRKSLKLSFPLLQYAIRTTNISYYVESRGSNRNGSRSSTDINQLLRAASDWLDTRLCIQAWIECSYFYGVSPSVAPILRLLQSCPLDSMDEVDSAMIFQKLQGLERDLILLRNGWDQVLDKEPSAIWTSTITAFTQSTFWLKSDHTNIIPIQSAATNPQEAEGARSPSPDNILLMSRVSQDGLLNGCARLHPSKAYRDRTFSSWLLQANKKGLLIPRPHPPQILKSLCSGWQLEYHIIHLATQKLVTHHMVDLPREDVFEALNMHTLTGYNPSDDWRFSFPLAISRDLRQVLVLRTLVEVAFPVEPAEMTCQPPGCFTTQHLRQRRYSSRGFTKSSYRVEFSPTNKAIAFVEAHIDGKLTTQFLELWSRDPATPNYTFRDYLRLGPRDSAPETELTFPFLFHPIHPMVVLAGWKKVYLWWFEEQEIDSDDCYTSNLIGLLRIHKDLLYYRFRRTIIHETYPLPISNYNPVDNNFKEQAQQPVNVSENWSFNLETLIEDHLRNRVLGIPRLRPYWLKYSDSTRTESDLGPISQGSELFAVQEGLQGQEVTIQSNRGERMKYGHFPFTPGECTTSVALLPNNGLDPTVRVVWNQEAKKSYSVLDKQSRHMPIVIERSRVGLLSLQSHSNAHSQGAIGHGRLLTDAKSNLSATAGDGLALSNQEPDRSGSKRPREPDADSGSPSPQTKVKRHR